MDVIGYAQQDLFANPPGPRARKRDPIVSQWSAARAERFWASQAGKVLAELRRAGPGTAHEIARALGGRWDNVRVCRRLSDLQRLLLAKPNGEINEGSRVWTATSP